MDIMNMEKGVFKVGKYGLMFWCKGCNMFHSVNLDVNNSPIIWDFDGNYEKPTITPSILVEYTYGPERKNVVCHSFITNGMIQYLQDCTHEFAGETLPLELPSS